VAWAVGAIAVDTSGVSIAATGGHEDARSTASRETWPRIVRRERERPAALWSGEGEDQGYGGLASNRAANENSLATASAPKVADPEYSFFIRGCIEHQGTSCTFGEHGPPHTLEGFGDIVRSLEDHPNRVLDEEKARFVLVPLPDESAFRLGDLPRRSAERPYIAFGWDRTSDPDKDRKFLEKRNGDVLVMGYDLRPFDNNTGRLPHGITLPPPLLFGCTPGFGESQVTCRSREPYDPTTPPKFFLTYRGDKKPGLFYTSSVRPDLFKAFTNFSQDNVIVEFSQEEAPNPYTYAMSFHNNAHRYHELFDSAFTLVPRGHGRWTYRLSEAIGACSIPVIMADGLTMPFEELIDWGKMSITLPESLAKQGAQAIIDRLPKDPAKIKEMRTEVCRINAKYFATQRIRMDAMLHAAFIRSRHSKLYQIHAAFSLHGKLPI